MKNELQFLNSRRVTSVCPSVAIKMHPSAQAEVSCLHLFTIVMSVCPPTAWDYSALTGRILVRLDI